MSILSEVYLESSLVSQVFEYDSGKLIASAFNENGYKLIDRKQRSIGQIGSPIEQFREGNAFLTGGET